MTAPPMSPSVAAAIQGYPPAIQSRFHDLRSLLFDVADSIPVVGPLNETLKWSEPAWLTDASRSGSTVRMAWKPKRPDDLGIFLNCQTDLVDRMRQTYPDAFTYEGQRAIQIPGTGPFDRDAAEHAFAMALTYHKQKES